LPLPHPFYFGAAAALQHLHVSNCARKDSWSATGISGQNKKEALRPRGASSILPVSVSDYGNTYRRSMYTMAVCAFAGPVPATHGDRVT
jgi:hypothetical protein